MATDLSEATDAGEPQKSGGPLRRRRRLLYIAVVAAVAVAATALVAGRTGRGRVDGLRAEGSAPAFDLPRVGAPDDRVTLKRFAGRPLVVNFWASWCVPCGVDAAASTR